ncbi:GmrSD restriction endonuclease domain-containing protein [Actinoallomurus rhizosphaericola]|uniref:GmrSD restriction endonuclease domain-containing protein n=1 Tax=Actinoallomurus rhizosphaericola TaxID=2952536 RepID=UPI002093BFFD|nr:DUF262 domain-containing protein [Actinoallomurus rhizosphaericola]MCO5997414.1 DUF262 domain-containing protein [Actinoallomurus rhizosphaericola]
MASSRGVTVATVTKPRVERTRPTELVEWTLSGRIRIPRFQRPFRWEKDDIRQLFDSIFRGYPIGNLLMWRRPAPKTSRSTSGDWWPSWSWGIWTHT